jgi:hypothetical protein
MSDSNDMCHLWLYLGSGVEGLLQLAQALSIPSRNLINGNDLEAVSADVFHMNECGLHYFELDGDFSLSCDIRLSGLTLALVHLKLLQLSAEGLRSAAADESSDNPFAFVLFESGRSRPVTVVEDDETNKVTLYSVSL